MNFQYSMHLALSVVKPSPVEVQILLVLKQRMIQVGQLRLLLIKQMLIQRFWDPIEVRPHLRRSQIKVAHLPMIIQKMIVID